MSSHSAVLLDLPRRIVLGAGTTGQRGYGRLAPPYPAGQAGGVAAGPAIRFPGNNDGKFSAAAVGRVDGA